MPEKSGITSPVKLTPYTLAAVLRVCSDFPLTAEQAAELFGVSRSKWYDLINKGFVPEGREIFGSLKRWSARELFKILEEQMSHATSR